jgi:hypothetical protein
MTKTRVDARLALALVLAAWSCAKANDNLGGGSYDPTATGGTTGTGAKGGTGGSFGTGGSSASGGKGGTSTTGGTTSTGGSTNAFGGTNATGGSTSTGGSGATGGTNSTGGSTSTGGSNSTGGTSTGGTSTGGSGGAPDLSNAEVVLYYQAKNTMGSADRVDMRLFIQNKAKTALDLSQVTVRYWMTAESPPNVHSYYSAAGMHLVVPPTFVDAGDNSYLEFSFGAGGQVPAQNTDLNATEFQGTIDTTNGGKFDQTNDWSFNAALDTDPPQPNDKITVYAAGKLIWGCEPSGACPGSGEGGAGGEAGQSTQAGQGGEPGTGGTGIVNAGQGGDTSGGGQAGI